MIGLSSNVGTTFIATWLAREMCSRNYSTAFLEMGVPSKGKPLMYEGLAFDERFINRGYYDYYLGIVNEDKIKKYRNIESGINWALITPEACNSSYVFNEIQYLKLIDNILGQLIVVDVSCDLNLISLDIFDAVVVVIDPLPSKLLPSKLKLQSLKKYNYNNNNVIWIVNKMNQGVNKKELRRFLNEKELIYIEQVALEEFYKCEYKCKFSFESKYLQEVFNDQFNQIGKKIDYITKLSQ